MFTDVAAMGHAAKPTNMIAFAASSSFFLSFFFLNSRNASSSQFGKCNLFSAALLARLPLLLYRPICPVVRFRGKKVDGEDANAFQIRAGNVKDVQGNAWKPTPEVVSA